MDSECSKSDVCDKVPKEKDEGYTTLRSGTKTDASSKESDIAVLSVKISKSDRKHYENQSNQKIVDNESVAQSAVTSSEADHRSSDLSVYNFDSYSSLSVVKRGRGRPRKDGRTSVQGQQRKMVRGRGRAKRDDGSVSVPQPKIFPGRPRVRAKRIRQMFMPTRNIFGTASAKPNVEMGVSEIKECSLPGDQKSSDIPSSSKAVSELDSEQKCSLCNLIDNNCLGQGNLKSYRPTPGFSPEKNKDESPEKPCPEVNEDNIKASPKKQKSVKSKPDCMRLRQKSPQAVSERSYSVQNLTAELMNIGFDTPPEIKQVFQKSGETYVHTNCAVWSEGVAKAENGFVNVDKAVLNGMFQKCGRCDKYGATVRCSVYDCNEIYHYPCAIVSGVLQAKSHKMYCSAHTDIASSNGVLCSVCKSFGDYSDLLTCTVCYKYYHGKCLQSHAHTYVDVNIIVKSGWQCSDCRTCQSCRQPGDENKILTCEACQKGFHTFCVKPAMASVPKNGWKCQSCRFCGDCGSKTPGSGPSSRWHLNYTVCDSCYQQRNKGVACPLCGKAYRQFSQRKEMRHCLVCRKYIHVECDPRISEESGQSALEYVCPICVNPVDMDDTICYGTEMHMPHNKDKPSEPTRSPTDVFIGSSRDSFSSDENSLSNGESDSYSDMASGKFASKRRAKAAEFRRRRRKKSPKAHSKNKTFTMPICFATAFSEPSVYKTEDDDPTAENKMVLVSANDEFVLCQDLCVMCGSFGKNDEGRLIACAQCGQCYHSYCASIKVTPVVLKKGWRCLDCTVCEGCGEPHDEGRLLLCDECDISFHIYCLDPPLSEVPPGNWKCKWCVICVKCGTRSPGINCQWQMNYTHCGPCSSFTVCPVCSNKYEDNELIIQCSHCQRWCHGKCDQIETEEHAEKCADCGYLCALCRPTDEPPPHLVCPELPPTPEPEPVPEKPTSPQLKAKDQDVPVKAKQPIQFYLDGICLSENGLHHIKSLTPELPKKISRPRKPRQVSFLPNFLSQSTSKYSSVPPLNSEDGSDMSLLLFQENTVDIKSEPDSRAENDDDYKVPVSLLDGQKDVVMDDIEKKRRPRKIQKLGIGGFVVKPRGRSSSTKDNEQDLSIESNQTAGNETFQVATGSETPEIATQDKPKRRRKPKKKTPLDDSFPAYLRDAFFGKDLLTACKKGLCADLVSQDDGSVESGKILSRNVSFPISQSSHSSSPVDPPVRSKIPDVQGVTESISGSQNMSFQETKAAANSSANVQGNLIYMLKRSDSTEQKPATISTKETFQGIKIKEEVPSVSVDLNSKELMTDSLGFPQIDSRDVDDVIEGALRDHASSATSQIRSKEALCNRGSGFLSDASNSPVNIPQPQSSSPFSIQRTSQIHAQSSPVHRDNILHHQDSNSSLSESESSDQSQISKSTMKWESDEALGLLSTISPVLYANINCPHLKLEFPNWSDRVKQIAKIWRNLSSEKRQPYLQKARENRATSRTQRTNTDVDRGGSKETKTQELDQEKQWKQFQALRQLQQQKQQKILQEQRAQDIDSPIKDQSYENVYGKKWGSDPSLVPKSEDGANLTLIQNELIQGGIDLPVRSQNRPNQFIQVSRICPPMEQNKIMDTMSLLGSSPNISPIDQYSSHQPLLSPRMPDRNRLTYSPTSPVPRQSLLISRAEVTQVPGSTLQKEILYTPPSTPRPQTSESFFQPTTPPRPQMKSPSTLINQFPPELSQKVPRPVTDVPSTTPFFVQAHGSGIMNRPANAPVTQRSMDISKVKEQIPNMLPSEHFLSQQQVPISPIASGIPKNIPFKDDIYSSMPGTPRPTIPSQECIVPQQSFEHILKDNPDPNKLMAHHQLRELLQKQQFNKPEMILQIRSKEAERVQWPAKGSGACPSALQYMSKDDCFREPLPPSVRTRNLSSKDCKSDVTADILSSNLKLELFAPSENEEEKCVVTSSSGSTVSTTTHNDVPQQASNVPINESPPTEHNIQVMDMKIEPPTLSSASKERDTQIKERDMQIKIEDGCQPPPVVINPSDISNAGATKKRKTTTGDIVKDLESDSQEHGSIANTYNLDVLPVGELELDDDELLGLGNDFNILEYADPELDKSLLGGEGEKSNILDEHLDLDDKELEDEGEIKDETDKDLVSEEVAITETEKGLNEVSNVSHKHRKSTEKCDLLSSPELQDETSKKSSEITDVIKKEAKSTFPSCNMQAFCPPEELHLKTEVPSVVKDLQSSSQPSMPFSPAIQTLGTQDTVSSYPPPIATSHFQVSSTGREAQHNVNSPGPHFQPPPIGTQQQQQRNIFPLHVGVSVRGPTHIPMMQSNIISAQKSQQSRPLLLQEQPLLLEDLVEEEKREQMRQTQEGLLSPQADLLSDIDFERLKDDVFSGPPDDSLGGPGSLLGTQEPLKPVVSPSQPSGSTHSFGPPPYSLICQTQDHNLPCPGPPRGQNLLQSGPTRAQLSNVVSPLGLPPPGVVLHGDSHLHAVSPQKTAVNTGGLQSAQFGPNFLPLSSPPVLESHTDQEKQKMLQYEGYLIQQQAVLNSQQKYFETDIIKLRKIKKALNAKQRQLRKNGSELTENDAVELAKICQEQATLQKQLDQIRKQSRQQSIALQDFRVKLQKRQQQQQQQPQIPQSPVHPSLSSMQSSPQSSHSPNLSQIAGGAPQSPMLPSSPLGATPHVQHSPNILQKATPAAASASNVQQQASPLVHSHMLAQQIQFQVPRPEGKSCPVQVTQISDNTVAQSERFTMKERDSLDKNAINQATGNVHANFADKPELICTDRKPDVMHETETNPSKSILSQSLPSSVTNTLNFTLRQTGMPTGCLPASDPNASDAPSQVNFIGMSPLKTHSVVDQMSDRNATSETNNPKNFPPNVFESNKESPDRAQTEGPVLPPSTLSTKPVIKDEMIFTFETAHVKLSEQDSTEANKIASSDSSDHAGETRKSTSALNVNLEKEPALPSPTKSSCNSESTIMSEFKASEEPLVPSENTDNAEKKIDLPLPIKKVKQEMSFETCEESHGSTVTSQAVKDGHGSSDEEVEGFSRKAVLSAQSDQEFGKQNVLLKQLLRNCPSAESCKQEPVEIKTEDSRASVDEASLEESNNGSEKKIEDTKFSKKPSYLDIRRAQLEREPTPPSGEPKLKAPKRKRPKKKKLDGKEGSPVRKKSRKGSLSKTHATDVYGNPMESQLTCLPPLRILEPYIQPNFNILSAFGSGDMNAKENQLKGVFGTSTMPNQSDVYSYFPYEKEHATPTIALPPSPPYRGFYSEEFPSVTTGKSDTSLFSRSADSQKTFRDIESPDTVLSSSSPECCLFEPQCNFPDLIFIDHIDQGSNDDRKSYSPVIPLVAPIPIRVMPYSINAIESPRNFDNEKDKENIPKSELKEQKSDLLKPKMGLGTYSAPLKDSGNVAVTLTLSASAADDISGVLSRLADLLKIPMPSTYDIIERSTSPQTQKLELHRKSKSSDLNIHSILNGKPRFCRHCDIVVLSAGIRKKTSDLNYISKEEVQEEEVIFCSTNCYMQFALTHQSALDKETATADHSDEKSKTDFPQNTSPENEDSDERDILKDSDIDKKEKRDDVNMEFVDFSDEIACIKTEKIDVDSEAMHFAEEGKTTITSKEEIKMPKKWKSVRYKYFINTNSAVQMYKPEKDLPEKVSKPFYHTIKPAQMPKDGRRCVFCLVVGDGDTNGCARLLNMDVDKWVHLNCALWSHEVYETQNGALMNVEIAFKRALMLVCSSCQRHGASLKCFKVRCANIYHFTCAMKDRCVFFKDKTLLCPHHTSKYPENELESLAVSRRVYIDRDEHKQVASMIQGDQYVMRIGNLVFLNIGQLLPQQMQAFHTPNCIYPVGYKVIRMYWSMRKLGKRCQYICSINEMNGKPEFHIQVKEPDHKDIILKDRTSKGLWQKVLYPIEKMRKQAKTIKIFPDFITGDDLFGLTEPAVLRIVESLPGVETLQDYSFRYGRSPFLELPLAINPTGCARSEPKLRTHVKRSHTLHTSNSSRTSFHSAFGGIEISSPYIKQFVHSKSSQYRKMKTEWRNNVYLARSRIQGLGLYAARDLEKHTMVIEYIGQLIRNEIAERNESVYDVQNRGIYMFRLDENRVIDATLCGGLARYINHSCNPNCVAEVVQIDRENKILIITNRRIPRGEELSYDYKFEVEDDQHKIPCLCRGPNCRKWMN